jgi:hypothetical protein
MDSPALNTNNPLEIRMIGIKALKDALGLVGMVKFMQQYDPGYGDYTKERLEEPDLGLDEIDKILRQNT